MVGFVDKSVFRREPTPADVAAACREIDEHKAAISSLQERIFILLSEVQTLRREQKEHHDQINVCKGVTTLARRIPEELLSKIFEHCLEDGWYRAPLVVSQVCSAWRMAARAPRVWSHIYVNCNASHFVGRTQFWLSMAAEAPLHITFAASFRGAPTQDITNVTNLLLSRVAQWRTLAFDPMPLREIHFILSLCASRNAKNLRCLTINTEVSFAEGVDGLEGDILNLGDVFSEANAPNLTAIKYSCNALPSTSIFPSHIRTLWLETKESPDQRPVSAEGYMAVTSNLTRLRNCSISMPSYPRHHFAPSPDPTRAITLPGLTSLTLYGLDDFNGLLGYFDVPSLRALHLRSSEDRFTSTDGIDTGLLTLLANSSPLLETLELHDVDLRPETFATCFMQLKELREIRLHDSHIDDETLGLLRGPNGLCPRLSRLDLRWCQNFQGSTLVNLVRSRNMIDGAGARTAKYQNGISGVPVTSDPIDEVTVINCSLVKEQDVLCLANMTVCRVVMRDTDDHCRTSCYIWVFFLITFQSC